MSCQARSLALETSIWGTAPEEITQWVLVEYPHTWPAKFSDISALSLPEGLREALQQVQKREGWKILWIRRPGCQAQYVYWWDLNTQTCKIAPQTGDWSGEWTEQSVWQDVHEAGVPAPTVLVCTHGSRDKCCGVLGGVVFASMRKILPDAVWQVSHLGGHRFAPTALCFPFGWMLGRIEEADCMDIALAVMSGSPNSIRSDIVRGDVRLTKRAQARDIWLREQCGTLQQVTGDSVMWRDAGNTVHHVQQTQRLLGELEVSCANRKTKPVSAWVFTPVL